MEWLEIFRLPQPLTTGEAFFTMWFIGFVGGYVAGRAHAVRPGRGRGPGLRRRACAG